MRVAIACCGLEHVHRGYESFSRELFSALDGRADVILFKGSGKRRPNEIVVPCVRRGFLQRFTHPQAAFYWEQVTFAIALIPYLILNKIDIVHYSEGALGNVLACYLRWTGSRIRLLQSNGGPQHPGHFPPEAFIHQVCKTGLDDALEYGIPPWRMHLIPHGIAPERFQETRTREIERIRFALPQNKFLILSLSALRRQHKRIDYLIREVAALHDASVFLCMAGEPTPETSQLRELAAKLLSGCHTFITVSRERIPELLASADLFVLPSLEEGFGIVLIEACSAGVPVVCNNSAHFRWVLGDAALYTDMAEPGALTVKLQEAIGRKEMLHRLGVLGKERVQDCYSWQVLAPRYLDMYRSIAEA
jgi:glycosyltransferase involved in cell wall biosynthesis